MTTLAVIVPLTRPQFAERIVAMFKAQVGAPGARLVFALNGPGLALDDCPGAHCIRTRTGKGAATNDVLPQLHEEYCCIWDDDDIYGPQYLAEVMRCRSLGVTGLAEIDYRVPGSDSRRVRSGGYQGGTLAFPTRGLPAWHENIDLCAELVWRRDLERQGLMIHPRTPGDYTYCRYDDPEHHHVFPFHPKF